MSAPDTGYSTRSIIAAGDDRAWPMVLVMLQGGATLFRPTGMRDFYTDHHGHLGALSLSRTRIKRLERDGVLRTVGVDRYGLVPMTEAAP